MPSTTVRRHPRKKPSGGTTTVKRHPRTIAGRKTVPHTRSIFDEDKKLQSLLVEKEILKTDAKRARDRIRELEKEYEEEDDETKWDEILDKKERYKDALWGKQMDLRDVKKDINKRKSELKEVAKISKSRRDWLKRRGPLSGTNKWGLKAPQIASKKIKEDYIIPMNYLVKEAVKKNPIPKPEDYSQFHASGSRKFFEKNQIMLSEIGRHRAFGRGTGHFGTGVYTFDSLERANEYQKSPEGEVVAFKLNQNNYLPFVTKNFKQGKALHDFGRELSRTSWRDLDTTRFPDTELGLLAHNAGLHYNPDLARHSVDLAESSLRSSYHPMTYYMSALGYDGIYHKQEMARYSDYGNIIYPHKIKEIYPNIEMKETA
jgi:hypothetical protein